MKPWQEIHSVVTRPARTVILLCLAILLASPALAALEWEGPLRGPLAQRGKAVVFIASDSRNGGVTGVFRGFEDAAGILGWKARFLDGEGRKDLQRQLLIKAIKDRPDGIVFGGFDADSFPAQVVAAQKARIVLVGWHAAKTPGPTKELFINVATSPATVAALAVAFVLKDALENNRPVGVVIFSDSQFQVARAKTRAMIKALAACRTVHPCRVLSVQDIPIADAARLVPEAAPRLIAQFGLDWTYSLAINDVYYDHLNFPLAFGHRPDIRLVSAGDGSSRALSRIASEHSQQAASVAEPLRMQGFQLADELNRALAGEPGSGYVSRPILVTSQVLKATGSAGIEAGLGFEAAYTRIWSGH